MNPKVIISCVAILFLQTCTVSAGIRPSFGLDHCTTRATHIIVIDQNGKILESWKGDLKVNDVIPLESLKLPNEEEIAKGLDHSFNRDKIKLSQTRRILFLIRGKDKWKPASVYDEMCVSMAWQEGEKIYAFEQIMNPGPTIIVQHELKSGPFFNRLKALVAVNSRFAEIKLITDPAQKAKALDEFVRTKIAVQYKEAIDELTRCGEYGESVLLKLLDDNRAVFPGEIIMAYVRLAGKKARPRLMREVKEGLIHWQKLAPTLDKDWWTKQSLENHHAYIKLYYSLTMLARIGIEDEDREPIEQLMDFWKSQPLLDGMSKGLNYNREGKLVQESQIAGAARQCLEKK